jgi:hypothetical protein
MYKQNKVNKKKHKRDEFITRMWEWIYNRNKKRDGIIKKKEREKKELWDNYLRKETKYNKEKERTFCSANNPDREFLHGSNKKRKRINENK